MGTEQKNLDIPMKVTGETKYAIDVRLPGMKWAAVKSCPVYGGDVKSYDFDAIRERPGVRSVHQFPIPDPQLTRGRVFSGGVAVIADTWYQAKTALDAMPIEWTFRRSVRRSTRRTCAQRCSNALDEPGRVRVNHGDVDAVFARADPLRVVEATYYTPYLPRARMEPGNATVLVTDDRVDIWIGDQSPQETRFSAAQITGIPEENVYLHMCHLGGGFGRNGNGPQAEQAIMIANANRGTPIHLLWTREEDFIGTTYRAMGMARLKAALDADGWPLALEVRTSMQQDGFGPDASFDVASRYYVPNYRVLESHDELSRAGRHASRRRAGRARVLPRELHRRARARGRQGSLSISPRADRAHGAAVQGRHAEGARHGRRDVGLGHAAAARSRPRDRARGARRRNRQLGDDQRDGAHDLRRAATAASSSSASTLRTSRASAWSIRCRSRSRSKGRSRGSTTTRCTRRATSTTARSSRTTSTRSRCRASTRIRPSVNIEFFPTAHWLVGMGHDRGTSVQAALADAIFQITGKRFRDSAAAPTRPPLELAQ